MRILLPLSFIIKLRAMELPFGKPYTLKVLILSFALLIIIFPVCYPFLGNPLYLLQKFSKPSSYDSENDFHAKADQQQSCDLFTGDWEPNPDASYYTNTTCWSIHDHINCMKYGRPDTEYLKWRWKPDGCELPTFNPIQFLEIVRDKSIAFVGDSLGRNQMLSLICLLSKVEYPIILSYTPDEHFNRFRYPMYNFTLVALRSPYLVKFQEAGSNGSTRIDLVNIYLDEVDEKWTTRINEFDYAILGVGPWFFRHTIYHENDQIVGCHLCSQHNVTELPVTYAYKKVFRTAFKALNSLKNYKGVTFLRTVSIPHYENGEWNEGGTCSRERPYRRNEKGLDGIYSKMYMTQLEEFKVAEKEGKNRGLKLRLFNVTHAMLLRPDGHPNRYGHWSHPNASFYSDCVHWCLPGPIDTWNEILQEMLKMEK